MEERKKLATIEVQGFEFSLDGMRKFKKADFIKTWEEKSKAKGAAGRTKRFDAEKAWDAIKAELDKTK